jgi:hypothetical protein
VPLAALIIAQDDDDAKLGSSALLPLLGQTVVEFQARQAHRIGATHIVICAAQLPGGLVAALDRLRSEGITASFARNARDAAESIHPDEVVLLFAQGAIATRQTIDALAAVSTPLILVRPHAPDNAHLELIDADHVWAGIARIDGALTRQTAAILGEWSLAPTLLRMAIQAGAARSLVVDQSAGDVRVVRNAREASEASRFLLGRIGSDRNDAMTTFGVGPIARILAEATGKVTVPFALIALMPLFLLISAVGLALGGWIKVALLVFLLAAIPAEVIRRLGAAALRSSRVHDWYTKFRPWLGRGLIVAAGYQACLAGFGWGSILLSLWVTWHLSTIRSQGRFDATEDSCALFVLLGFVLGYPVIGLVTALVSCLLTTLAPRLPAKTPI